jgi:uncharacterized delta-60 repeat protein
MKLLPRCILPTLVAASVFAVSGSAAAVSPGDLDPTFGAGGLVTTDLGPFDRVNALVVQSDGKIVAAGTASTTAWGVARYLPDGRLDQTFGVGGKVLTDAPAGTAFSLALGPEDTILVGGFGQVARYLPNGALDSGFGAGGRIAFPSSIIRAIVVLPDGRTLLGGSRSRPTGDDFFVARLERSGALDAGFGSGGSVVTDLGGFDLAAQLLLLPDGRFVAVGETASGASSFALVRYRPDGSLDPTFGSGGKVISDIGPTLSDHGDDAVLTADGKIVVTGASFPNIALARYSPTVASIPPSARAA